MSKKIITSVASLVALAAFMAVPAIASASPVLTESGSAVATGQKILATNSGNILLTTSSGTVTCTKSQMTGTLVTNSGSNIEGTIESGSWKGEGTEERCKSTFLFSPQFKVTPEGFHWCITSSTVGSATVRGGACNAGAANLSFTLDSSFGNCKYSRASVAATYSTGVTPVKLTIAAGQTFTLVEGGEICPGTGTLSGAYTLETDVSPFTGLSVS
jgi:hypothetical protein